MSTPSSFSRIGKSLIKFFKPVRVALPHDPKHRNSRKWESQQHSDSPSQEKQSDFKLVKFKKPSASETTLEKAEQKAEDFPVPTQPPAQWLDLVLYLVKACRRVSDGMKKTIGISTYKTAVLNKGKHKIRTIGSIINTETTDIETKTEESA